MSDNSHLWGESDTGMACSRMVWVMGFKTDKIPQVHLIYGFILQIIFGTLVPIFSMIILSCLYVLSPVLFWPQLFWIITGVLNFSCPLMPAYCWKLYFFAFVIALSIFHKYVLVDYLPRFFFIYILYFFLFFSVILVLVGLYWTA